FKTIIWATDGSASAAKALPMASGLAKTMGGRLVIAHVEEVVVGRAGAPTSTGDEAQQTALNEHVRMAERHGVPSSSGRTGRPPETQHPPSWTSPRMSGPTSSPPAAGAAVRSRG